MWENENQPGQRIKIIDDDEPHLKDLCEACHKGKCIIANKKIENYSQSSYSYSNYDNNSYENSDYSYQDQEDYSYYD